MNRCLPVIWTAALALAVSAVVPPVRAQTVASDVLIKAKSNCLASVAKVVGLPSSRLKVIRQTSNASGLSIDVKVPNATAAWGCLTDRQGKVEDVHFKGSEGAL
jgi:hypothetical protein